MGPEVSAWAAPLVIGGVTIEPLTVGAVAAVVLAFFVALRILRNRGGVAGPTHLDKVRQLVGQGKLKEAALVHQMHGHNVEALNLLKRGEHFEEASKVAEVLGQLDQAAMYAEKAKAFERAADLYAKAERFGMAGKLYKRTGQFRKAAEAMEVDADSSIEDIAQMWEHACMEMMPKEQLQALQSADPRLVEARHMAQKAAQAYKKAGNNERAAVFFELSDDRDKAEQLRSRSVEQARDRLTQVPGMAGTAATVGALGPIGGSSLQPSRELAEMVSHAVKEVMRDQPLVVNKLQVDKLVAESGGATFAPPVGMMPGGFAGGVPSGQVIYIHDSRAGGPAASSEVGRQDISGRYQIEGKLGEGGMAEVFKAVDSSLERVVALKFLPGGMTQNELALRYFEREAKAAARLNHPNIVTIYDCGLMDGRPFISMEYIEGQTVDDVYQQGEEGCGMPMSAVLEVAEGLFSALSAVHEEGLVHRDVKPSNIMYTRHGTIKLMDFGIAGGSDSGRNTFIVGTPYYMAPEQFAGQGIDHRTDLFAAGATLYELVTGRRPFRSAERSALPERPMVLRPDIPPAFEELIGNCLQFDIKLRPKSARQVLSVIKDLQIGNKRSSSANLTPLSADTPVPSALKDESATVKLASTNIPAPRGSAQPPPATNPFMAVEDPELEEVFDEAFDLILDKDAFHTPEPAEHPAENPEVSPEIAALLSAYLDD